MNIRILLAAAALIPGLAMAQQILEKKEKAAEKAAEKAEKSEKAAKPAAKPAAGKPIATVNGVVVPQARADFLMQQQAQRGAPDTEQMRGAVREELINREVLAQEARKAGAEKAPEVQTQLDMVRQEIVVELLPAGVRAQEPGQPRPRSRRSTTAPNRSTATRNTRRVTSWSRPRTRRKGLIADLKKGAKFDELATKNSKDTGSAQRGGDLDWNVPGTFDKQFSDAMVKLDKGKYTDAPV